MEIKQPLIKLKSKNTEYICKVIKIEWDHKGNIKYIQCVLGIEHLFLFPMDNGKFTNDLYLNEITGELLPDFVV